MSEWEKIVKTILKENTIYLDEDAEKDYRFIKEAEVVWDRYIENVKNNIDNIIDIINTNDSFDIDLLIDNDIISILTKFDKNDSVSSYYGYLPDKSFKEICINLGKILAIFYPNYEQYFINHSMTKEILLKIFKLPIIKSTFLHEFQHYIYHKNKNGKNYDIKKQLPNLDNEMIFTKYRQDHNENNSYIMQDLDHLITGFEKRLKNFHIDISNKIQVKSCLNDYLLGMYNMYQTPDWYKYGAYDGDGYRTLSGQPIYTKGTHMEKQYYKRIYNLLYYLFVEDNINNAKKIYNEIKNSKNVEKLK